MQLPNRNWQVRGKSLALLLIASALSGCATVAEKLADTDDRPREVRHYETRRITLADVPTPKSRETTGESMGVATASFEEPDEISPLVSPSSRSLSLESGEL